MAIRPTRSNSKGRAGSARARRLAADIDPLARKIAKLQKEAAALGIFTEDRALLDCPKCGLLEDVRVDGRLFTAFADSPERDTGLRFVRTKKAGVFRCPSCGADVLEPEEMDSGPTARGKPRRQGGGTT